MARLPTVGGDDGNWGSVLNTFLGVEHASDGTLKNQPFNVKNYGAVGGFNPATFGGSITTSFPLPTSITLASLVGDTLPMMWLE